MANLYFGVCSANLAGKQYYKAYAVGAEDRATLEERLGRYVKDLFPAKEGYVDHGIRIDVAPAWLILQVLPGAMEEMGVDYADLPGIIRRMDAARAYRVF